jgi:hypothetical protein
MNKYGTRSRYPKSGNRGIVEIRKIMNLIKIDTLMSRLCVSAKRKPIVRTVVREEGAIFE